MISHFTELASQLIDFLKLNGHITGLLTFFIGLLVGNWQAIGIDRRKEFNTFVEPVRKNLFSERENPFISTNSLTDFVAFELKNMLPFWQRFRFNRAFKKYKQSKGKQNIEVDSMGSSSFKDTKLIIQSIDLLLKYVVRK